MPSSEEILSGLTRIATESFPFAVAWHVAFAAIVFALWRGWKMPAFVIAAPIISASAFAWAYGNPFNGVLLAATAAGVLVFSGTSRRGLAVPPEDWKGLGSALLLFAWIYPHFVMSGSPFVYLYGAPVGLLPCPSLAMATGLTLVSGPRRSDLLLATAGLFYGLFGLIALGMWLDAPLIAGAFGLFVRAYRSAPRVAGLPR